MNDYEHASAIISDDGLYRYQLRRRWAKGKIGLFVMLNPSTADGVQDDPTVRRCVSFCQREGMGGMIIANLFAYRTSEPAILLNAFENAVDIVGPENRKHLAGLMLDRHISLRIMAWGGWWRSIPVARRPARPNVEGMKSLTQPMCLGRTRDGQPRHPLYLSAYTKLEVFK